MELGEKLKQARMKAGLKQEELAQKIGVSRQTVSNWENDRSYPDLGSAVKLSNLYRISMDELLKDGADVIRSFEDLAQKRRKFWQMMLEIGIILELLGSLLAGQKLVAVAVLCFVCGLLLIYLSIFMHLRVFDHDRGEILRGGLGLGVHIVWNVLALLGVNPGSNGIGAGFVQILTLLLLWSAGVFTIDFKSTRLWLIIALFLGTPLLNIGIFLQDSGSFNEADPFEQQYQIAQVLYPEGGTVPEYTKIELTGSHMYVSDRNGDRTASYGSFTYVEPVPGESRKGTWRLIPEEAPESMFQVTVEADDSILLSFYRQEQLRWQGQLTPYGRNTCVVDVSTSGKSIYFQPDWHAPGRADPEPDLVQVDVIGDATMKLTVAGLDTQTLSLYEEYHHGSTVKTAVYTLEPIKPHRFELELETRYDGEEEWALYRIPYQDGEYRFTLTFG